MLLPPDKAEDGGMPTGMPLSFVERAAVVWWLTTTQNIGKRIAKSATFRLNRPLAFSTGPNPLLNVGSFNISVRCQSLKHFCGRMSIDLILG